MRRKCGSKVNGLNLDETDAETSGKKRLSKGEKTSLILILASVALWYMGV